MNIELHELAAAYALDALEADERAAFEAHLATCPSCPAEVASFAETAAQLATIAATSAPESMRAKVLASIAATDPTTGPTDELAKRRSRGRSRLQIIAASVAAAALAVGATASIVNRDNTPDPATEVLAAADVRITTLDGETGAVQIAWSAELDEVSVFGNNVNALDDGQTFQLWFVFDDGSVSGAGLFGETNGVARRTWSTKDLEPTSWGVTVEPAGGSDQPTSDIVYFGSLD